MVRVKEWDSVDAVSEQGPGARLVPMRILLLRQLRDYGDASVRDFKASYRNWLRSDEVPVGSVADGTSGLIADGLVSVSHGIISLTDRGRNLVALEPDSR